jgi:hypothetical protein
MLNWPNKPVDLGPPKSLLREQLDSLTPEHALVLPV